ncbi:hypothetical protein DACRYDRAFT_21631 [Dacryopinax primogenitus]|uniref:Uncharacterized protein n=1 Tax=Dacryopinax primogenitus (strain DJM 731) TaxID=1858805 RepID=M5G2V7_DACPD|nr:uncharacterized protein DACRYDRAFT_21631 [Dacryopinax primogenitus]EJU02560.1 hypothetical protein DACRYDRAFT_21631 [Dacryopinax primogenitus]
MGITLAQMFNGAAASEVLVHADGITTASKHYSRNTGDYALTAIITGEHEAAGDVQYQRKRARQLLTSPALHAGLRSTFGTKQAYDTTELVNVDELDLPPCIPLARVRKLQKADEESREKIQQELSETTEFLQFKEVWDKVCQEDSNLQTDAYHLDNRKFKSELRKAHNRKDLDPDAWVELIENCTTLWDAYVKTVEKVRCTHAKRAKRDELFLNKTAPQGLSYTHADRQEIIDQIDAPSGVLAEALEMHRSAVLEVSYVYRFFLFRLNCVGRHIRLHHPQCRPCDISPTGKVEETISIRGSAAGGR